MNQVTESEIIDTYRRSRIAEIGKTLFCKDCAAAKKGTDSNLYCVRHPPTVLTLPGDASMPMVLKDCFCFDLIPKEDK